MNQLHSYDLPPEDLRLIFSVQLEIYECLFLIRCFSSALLWFFFHRLWCFYYGCRCRLEPIGHPPKATYYYASKRQKTDNKGCDPSNSGDKTDPKYNGAEQECAIAASAAGWSSHFNISPNLFPTSRPMATQPKRIAMTNTQITNG